MSTLKQRIFIAFVPTVGIAIIVIGVVLSILIDGLIDKQSLALNRHTDAQLQERLQSSLKTFDLLIEYQFAKIAFMAKAISESDKTRSFVRKSQADALINELKLAMNSAKLDFASILDLDEQVLASFPLESDDIALANSYRVSRLASFIKIASDEDEASVELMGNLLLDHDLLINLGLSTASQKDRIGMVMAKVIENDFGDKLGVLIVGKLLDRWEQELAQLNDLAETAFVIYRDFHPVISVGFPRSIAQQELGTMAVNSVIPQALTVQSFGDERYHFMCQPLMDFAAVIIGNSCSAISDEEASVARIELENLTSNLATNIHLWLLVFGGITVISLMFLAVLVAQKIANPLLSVTKTMKRLSENKLDTRIPESGGITEIETMLSAISVFKENAINLHDTQDLLLRQERLATLGQLAATVSHELRNPLGTIRTSMVTLSDRTQGKGLGVERALARVERNIIRCDNIISDLLDYARDREPTKKPILIDNWLAETLKEIGQPDGVNVRLDLASDAKVPFDHGALRQNVVNLFDNAVQAMVENRMKDSKESILTVSSRVKGCRVEVTFSDTGPGISAENLDKIFEPLFSTKTYGVGLGLPLVKKIMEQHNGGIEMTSIEGQGTQAMIWLPLDEPAN